MGSPNKGRHRIEQLIERMRDMTESVTESGHDFEVTGPITFEDPITGDLDEYAPTTRNDYKSKISYFDEVNKPIMAIFFNYFNILSHKRFNEKTLEVDGVQFKGVIDSDDVYIDYLPDFPPIVFDYKVILTINNNDILFVMLAYKEGREIRNIVKITSLESDTIKSHVLYERLFNSAVDISNLKGSYITISDKVLEWKIRELKKLTFDDVFLPETLSKDLEIYIKLFEDKNILPRYMFSGIPGTGKTESTRAISYILNNNHNVTVIKTNICDIIKQKFELAVILAPSLIILDDIDLYLGDRNHGGTSHLLGQFLDILDGVDKLPPNVGVIASTNAPHLIDLAAQRPGRFNKLLFFDNLTLENISNIIKKSLNTIAKKDSVVTEEDITLLTDVKLLKFFKDSGATGAYIFETIKNVKYKSDILKEPLDLKLIIGEIELSNKTIADKLKSTRIENTLKDPKGSKIGY